MPPDGGQVYLGSRVHLVSAQPAGDVVVSVNTIEVRPGLVWAAIECPAVPVTLVSQGLPQSEIGTKTAFPEVAYKGISQPGIKRCVSLGNGHLQGDGPCRVRVGNIGSSGEDGVSIVDLDTDGLVAFANREAAVPAYSEIVVRARGRTTAVPPVSDAPLGEVHLVNGSPAEGGHFTADFSILGAPQVRVIVVGDAGTTVGENPASPQARPSPLFLRLPANPSTSSAVASSPAESSAPPASSRNLTPSSRSRSPCPAPVRNC